MPNCRLKLLAHLRLRQFNVVLTRMHDLVNARSVGEKSAAMQRWISSWSSASPRSSRHGTMTTTKVRSLSPVLHPVSGTQKQLVYVDESRLCLLVLRPVAACAHLSSVRRRRHVRSPIRLQRRRCRRVPSAILQRDKVFLWRFQWHPGAAEHVFWAPMMIAGDFNIHVDDAIQTLLLVSCLASCLVTGYNSMSLHRRMIAAAHLTCCSPVTIQTVHCELVRATFNR